MVPGPKTVEKSKKNAGFSPFGAGYPSSGRCLPHPPLATALLRLDPAGVDSDLPYSDAPIVPIHLDVSLCVLGQTRCKAQKGMFSLIFYVFFGPRGSRASGRLDHGLENPPS